MKLLVAVDIFGRRPGMVREVLFTKGDLYEYGCGHWGYDRFDAWRGSTGVIGASENGEYIYYVDGAYNLNVWHAGQSQFIATLSPQDDE